MQKSFDDLLGEVRGKIREVPIGNMYVRKRRALLYYLNGAEDLRKGALLVWDEGRGPRAVFSMLAAMSLELLLKGTLMGLLDNYPASHKLAVLCDRAGIPLRGEDRETLNILSEYTIWAARYPATRRKEDMEPGLEILRRQYPVEDAGQLGRFKITKMTKSRINLETYDRLWEMMLGYYFQVQSSVYESATS